MKTSDSHPAVGKTGSYDIEVLHEIARQVNWDAIHGPKWMKAGRFSPGPGLGEILQSREGGSAHDDSKRRSR
jgi:hypothetical protein